MKNLKILNHSVSLVGMTTLALLVAQPAHSNNSVSPYIINGTEAQVSDYPFMGLLFINYLDAISSTVSTFCGGTLIDEQHVLTAAHCVYAPKNKRLVAQTKSGRFQVAFNIQNILSEIIDSSKHYTVTEIYYPDNYDSTFIENDIAILKLSSPVDSNLVSASSYIKESPSEADYRKANFEFKVIGYGLTLPEIKLESGEVLAAVTSDVLNETSVNYVENTICPEEWNVTDKQICTTGEILATDGYDLRSGSCQGDSGGPLLYVKDGSLYQAGVVSYGPSVCGNPGVAIEGVYTEVSDYSSWIANVLSGQETAQYTSSDSSSSTSGGGSSGGSIGWFILTALGFIGWKRRRN